MSSKIGQIFSAKMAVSFGTQFWGFASYAVFFAPWLVSKGLNAAEVAFVLALAQFVKSMFGPVGALIADGFEYKKTPILIMNFLSAICILALYFVDGQLAIIIVVLLYSIASAAIVPVLEGLAVKGATKFDFDFGRSRLWGSVAFVISSYACGKAIDVYGLDVFISWLLFSAIISCLAAMVLPVLSSAEDDVDEMRVKKFDLVGAYMLIKHPIFITILVTVSFIQASHAVYYGFSAIHWASIGYSSELIGLLWATGVVAEVALFAFAAKFAMRFGPRHMLILAAFMAIIRWVVLAFDPALMVVFLSQILHAFTFGAVYLGAVNLISRSVPDNLISTAMAINVSLNMGIFMSTGFVIAGWLYADYANQAYWFAAMLALIGLIMALGLKFIWNGGALSFTSAQATNRN